MAEESPESGVDADKSKSTGVEAVLDYFPDMSAYQMLIFLYCYYGYMGVATSVAGNIFYQYETKFSCAKYSNSSSELVQQLGYLNLTDKKDPKKNDYCHYNKPTSCSLEDYENLSDHAIQECFSNSTTEKCHNFIYNDRYL